MQVRTYGMNFINYHPYLKLGIAYYNLGQLDAALQAFDTEEGFGAIAKSPEQRNLASFRKLATEARQAATLSEQDRIARIRTAALQEARGLEQDGHKVEVSENGRLGLEKLGAGSFDLVLLDIEMPEMNGYQVLETCLQNPELREIPIIMTSSLDEIDSVVKCVELGAEDYLNKPVNPILLRARVNASLEKKRLRDEQRKLFRTFATKEVADELLKSGFSLGGKYVNASVMFADIRSYTTYA